MERIIIKAEKRTVKGKQVKVLRRQDKLPAVLYGRHTEPISILLPLHKSSMILARLSSSALVNIELDGESYLALVREKQRNFLTDALLHIDFLVVSATELLRTSVSVELVGEAPAVKNLNGILVTNLSMLEVEALPQDLPESIKVDVSGLAEIGDSIHVSDLVVPEGVRVLADLEEVVALVAAQGRDEDAEAAEAAAAAAEPAVIEKGKKEEEA